MRTILILSVASLLIMVAAIVKRTRISANAIEHDGPRRSSRHAVPPDDYASLNSKAGRHLPEALKRVALPDDRPAVLIFLKADCECSNDFARLFNALEQHLRPTANALAVIEGTDEQASAFVAKNGFNAPFLAQDRCGLAAAWGIGKAGAVAFVRPNGEAELIWPGISRQVFRDITNRMGHQNLIPEEIMNSLPGASTAGCPLDPTSVSFSRGVDR